MEFVVASGRDAEHDSSDGILPPSPLELGRRPLGAACGRSYGSRREPVSRQEMEARKMALVRWSPRTELESFGRDRLFRRFFDLFDDERTGSAERIWYPPLDLIEEKD